MVKKLGYGVYEVDGFVIDVLNLTDELFEAKRRAMSREDYIGYTVAVNMAGHYADEDGIFGDLCDGLSASVIHSDQEWASIFYRMACKEYEAYINRKNGVTDCLEQELLDRGQAIHDENGKIICRG